MKTISLSAFALAMLAAQGAGAEDLVARGEYLARIMDCQGCHTTGALAGKPDPAMHLAGSTIGFGIPDVGVMYPPNLTPDRETGLGSWSDEDLVRAVRTGMRPDGRQLAPVMPWPSYAALSDADAKALAAYLKSLPAVRHRAPPPAGTNGKPAAPYLSIITPQ
ncbi:MAG TPA: c-type cytochrome [Azospirillum sp.]|nr:c-type cytochrome [Azospirillum sp.]